MAGFFFIFTPCRKVEVQRKLEGAELFSWSLRAFSRFWRTWRFSWFLLFSTFSSLNKRLSLVLVFQLILVRLNGEEFFWNFPVRKGEEANGSRAYLSSGCNLMIVFDNKIVSVSDTPVCYLMVKHPSLECLATCRKTLRLLHIGDVTAPFC